jgi:hypothetical protein
MPESDSRTFIKGGNERKDSMATPIPPTPEPVPPVIPEADKPFYLAIGATLATAFFGALMIIKSPNIDPAEAQSVFTFFAGLLGASWGYYFGTKSQQSR